jgi:phospholipase C
MASSGQPTPASALGNITHVIVLMFENRSFDHLLGAMPGVDGVLDPSGNVYSNLYNTKDPVASSSAVLGPNDNRVYPAAIFPDIGNELSPNNESNVFQGDDFNHSFSDGMLCDLYGPGTTGIIGGQPQNAPPTTRPPTNSGFLVARGNDQGKSPIAGVMSYFAWNSMQVFHPLARNFVTCDAWHCDMPGHTAPNRAFMHCATTGDLGIDDVYGSSLYPYPALQRSVLVNRATIFGHFHNN